MMKENHRKRNIKIIAAMVVVGVVLAIAIPIMLFTPWGKHIVIREKIISAIDNVSYCQDKTIVEYNGGDRPNLLLAFLNTKILPSNNEQYHVDAIVTCDDSSFLEVSFSYPLKDYLKINDVIPEPVVRRVTFKRDTEFEAVIPNSIAAFYDGKKELIVINDASMHDFGQRYGEIVRDKIKERVDSGAVSQRFNIYVLAVDTSDIKKMMSLVAIMGRYGDYGKEIFASKFNHYDDIIVDKSVYECAYTIKDTSNGTCKKYSFDA